LLTYAESLRLLFQLERLGMKFGLEGISRLLKGLSDPQEKFRTVHVAGTNGKGSTASMLAAMLTSAGYRTGLYTSPHLVRFEERIRIDGKPISKAAVAKLTSRLRKPILKNHPTFFEATTALAFAHFADEEVDIAVVEAGLGGRLDSTNVIKPIVSIITNVGLDHTEILGDTVEKIAFEKAGIIKRGRPCITGVQDPGALAVIKRAAREKKSPLVVATDFSVKVRSSGLEGSSIDYKSKDVGLRNLKLSLPGRYQLNNLAVALSAVEVLKTSAGIDVPELALRAGLSNVQGLTGLAGRLTLLQEQPRVIADVAHNPDAVRNLVHSMRGFKIEKLVTVFGVLKDKDYLPMVRDLGGVSSEVIAVAPRSERARSASDVAAAFQREGNRVRAALSVEEGVKLALGLAGNRGAILITGSHYVVGEAMSLLARKRA
jgi:dihydrofolate synthase/folylpolyglutamate synthase